MAAPMVAPMAAPPRISEAIEASATPQELRKMSQDEEHKGIRERVWGLEARVDPTVTFEEFRYWAKIERALEQEENRKYLADRGPVTALSVLRGRFSKGIHHDNQMKEEERLRRERAQQAQDDSSPSSDSGSGTGNVEKRVSSVVDVTVPPSAVQPEAEWRQAARAFRTASWGTIFYLVTTDILGWSSTPYVFASVGYGLGVGIFIIFGIAAAFGGFSIWRVFLGLDSARFPMLSYGDTYFRVFGSKARHVINVLQSLQQFLSVTVVLLTNATYLAQIAQSKLCYVVCFAIIMVVGMISGGIRSLQRIGWMCNASVWLNVVNFAIICIGAAHFLPDYSYVAASTLIKTIEPAVKFAGVPAAKYQQQSTNLATAQLNGVDQMIYAYSGAILFVAFLAEMRHPMDFWKGMLIAQAFICFVYIFFGAFVYSFYGQYSASSIGQVVTPYGLQTAGNVFSLLTGFFAIFLYFNVGMKTVYLEVFQEILHFPPIITKKGKMMWFILGPIYWILAFIVAASVPNLNTIVSLVGALFSLNFTYSLPALSYCGYRVLCAASLPGEGFDPATGVTTRHDRGWRRWARGYRKDWKVTVPTTLFVLGGLACSGLGTWASVEGAIQIFGPGGTVATSWGCAVPV